MHTSGVVSLRIPAEMKLTFSTVTVKVGRNEVPQESHPLDSTMDPSQWWVVTFTILEAMMGENVSVQFMNYN